MLITCKELFVLSAQYPDGDLALRKKLAIRFHLTLCRHCRNYIHAMDLTKATIKKLPLEISEEKAKMIVEEVNHEIKTLNKDNP